MSALWFFGGCIVGIVFSTFVMLMVVLQEVKVHQRKLRESGE